MRKSDFKGLALIVLMILLGGCGGGSGEHQTKQIEDRQKGLIQDVTGLRYRTSSGLNGIVGKNSNFLYKDGDTVSFFAGNLHIGDVKAKEKIVLQDFNNSDNVAQALYSLDEDKNPDNGIDVGYLNDKASNANKSYSRVSENNVEVDLQEITDNPEMLKKYKAFLKENGAMLISKEKVDKIEAKKAILTYIPEIENIAKQKAKGGFAEKRIILGTQIENELRVIFDKSFQNTLGAKRLVNDSLNVQNDSYYNRVKVATLYSLNMSLRQSVLEQAYSNVEADKERDAYRNQVKSALQYAFDTGDAIANAMKKPNFDNLLDALDKIKIYNAKFAYDFTAPYSERSEATNVMVGISASILSECVSREDKKKKASELKSKIRNCVIGTIVKNAASPLVKKLIDNPMYDSAVDGEVELLFDTVDLVSAAPAEMPVKFIKLVAKNVVNLGFAAAQIQMLSKDRTKLNSFVIAKELFNMIQTVSPWYDRFDYNNLISRKADTATTQKLRQVSSLFGLGELQTSSPTGEEFTPFTLLQNLSNEIAKKHSMLQSEENLGNFDTKEIVANLEKFGKIYDNLYEHTYNHYIGYKNVNTKEQKYQNFLANLHFKITKVLLKCDDENECKVYAHFGYDSSEIGAVVLPKRYSLSVNIKGMQQPAVKEYDIDSRHAYSQQKYTAVVPIELSSVSDINTTPVYIKAQLEFSPKIQLASYENASSLPHLVSDEKAYIASVFVPQPSSVKIGSHVAGNNKYDLVANVEDNRLGIHTQDYIYEWKVGCLGKKVVTTTQKPRFEYKLDAECKDKSVYAKVDVYDSFDDQAISSPFVSDITRLEKIRLSDELEVKLYVPTVLQDGQIVTVHPQIKGGKPPYTVSIETGEHIKKVGENRYETSNDTGDFLESNIIVHVSDSNGEEEDYSIVVTIAPKINKKGYVQFIRNWDKPSDGSIVVQDFTKKWAIKNDTDFPLNDVYISFNEARSSTSLEHAKMVQIGQIAPAQTKVIELPIKLPQTFSKNTHYGYFELWYKENGTAKRLKYSSHLDAYLTYFLKTKQVKNEQLNIETFTIKSVGEDAQNQYFVSDVACNAPVASLEIESESGNVYRLVSGGIVFAPIPSFIDTIEQLGDKAKWKIHFHIRKADEVQHKTFRLRAKGVGASVVEKEVTFDVKGKNENKDATLLQSFDIQKSDGTQDVQNYKIDLVLSKVPKSITLLSDSGNRYKLSIKEEGRIEYRLNNAVVTSKEEYALLTPFDDIQHSDDYKRWNFDFHVYKTDKIQNKKFTVFVEDGKGKTESAEKEFVVEKKTIETQASMNIYDVSIVTMQQGDNSVQEYNLYFSTTDVPKNITIVSEQGNRYDIVKNGVINKNFPFIIDIMPSSERTDWVVDFKITKTDSIQHKRFTILAEDESGKSAQTSIAFDVDKL